MSTPIGNLIRARRNAVGLSLRAVADVLDVSHTFVGECERTARKLPRKYWPALCTLLKNLTIAEMNRADIRSRPVVFDIAEHRDGVQDMILELAAALNNRTLPPFRVGQIRTIISNAAS